jgi:hypothetical protein
VETDVRSKLTARLAERGLAVESFDGTILTLAYNPTADQTVEQSGTPTADELSRYARTVLLSIPGGEALFPQIGDVAIDFAGRQVGATAAR